jgi:hypothetical protein
MTLLVRAEDEDETSARYRRGMTGNVTVHDRRRPRRAALAGGALATAVALLGGLLVGGLTSPGQTYLPSWINPLANSIGGWSMLTFLLVWLSRARPVLGAVLGVIAFQAMLEGYGIVSLWRGYYYAEPFSTMWVIPGIAAGLVLGSSAAMVRHAQRALWRVLGVVPLAVVLLGDGIFSLVTVSDTTGWVYCVLEMIAGVGFAALAILRRRRG